MMKIATFFAVLAVASAAPQTFTSGFGNRAIVVAARQPIVSPVHSIAIAPTAEPFDPHPQYSYSYSVSDAETGDSKTASETRDGDAVQGSYSVVEPDGALRTVTYTADAVNGFNAKVERIEGAAAPIVSKPVVVPVVRSPVVVAAAPKVVKTIRRPAAAIQVIPQTFGGFGGYYPFVNSQFGVNYPYIHGNSAVQYPFLLH